MRILEFLTNSASTRSAELLLLKSNCAFGQIAKDTCKTLHLKILLSKSFETLKVVEATKHHHVALTFENWQQVVCYWSGHPQKDPPTFAPPRPKSGITRTLHSHSAFQTTLLFRSAALCTGLE
ncbi:hypothetical protein M758_8G049900 [Ceratodon purpureus]|nr:hypothetical protein M758_8G049900 [Ceratodon purpureus]